MATQFLRRRFRPRIFRAFQAWYKKHHASLTFSLRLTECESQVLSFRIETIHESISILFDFRAILVAVRWQGTPHLLVAFDTGVARNRLGSNIGVHCAGRLNQKTGHCFMSRTELWEHHLFAPLAQWLNNELANATHVCIGGTPRGYARESLNK